MIALCGLFGIDNALEHFAPTKIVSVLDPPVMIVTPPRIKPWNHLKIAVHDIEVESDGMVCPEKEHIERILHFGEKWNRSERLLVHCWAGVSRSSATVLLLLTQKYLGRETQLAHLVRERAEHVRPNKQIIALGDQLLGCNGRLIAAVGSMREPTLRDLQEGFIQFPSILDVDR